MEYTRDYDQPPSLERSANSTSRLESIWSDPLATVPQYSQQPETLNRHDSDTFSTITLPPAYTPNPSANSMDFDTELGNIVGKQGGWYHGVRYNVDELWKAALQGNTSTLQKCLKAGLSVNYCRWCRDKVIGKGVRCIADIVASKDDVRSMRLLLEYNVDLTGAVVSVFANKSQFGAQAAFGQDDHEVLEDDLWTTPLHEACKSGHLDMISVLLDEGKVNPHTMDNRQRTGLFIATKSNKIAVVQRLLSCGVAIELENAGGITPLASAAYAGSLDIVDLLLRSGAKPDIADTRGETALYNASLVGNHNIVAKLVAFGADVNIRNLAGTSAFFTAASRFKSETMAFLLECGADSDIPDANGCTALLRAVMAKNIALVKYLLDLGADIDTPDDRGWTPLFAAMIHGDEVLIRLLLENGCDILKPDLHGNTPLHQAAMLNANTVVRHILAQKHSLTLDLSRVNSFGETALILASKYNQISIVKNLLKHGADSGFIDPNGHTALDRAMYHANYACVRHLLIAGARVDDNALRSLKAGKSDQPDSRSIQKSPSNGYDMISRMLHDEHNIPASAISSVDPSPLFREYFALAITLGELRARMRTKQRRPVAINPETGGVANQAALREAEASDPFEACIPNDPATATLQSVGSASGGPSNSANAARLGMNATSLALNVAGLTLGA